MITKACHRQKTFSLSWPEFLGGFPPKDQILMENPGGSREEPW